MSMEKHLGTKEHKAGTRATNVATAALVLSITLSTEQARHAAGSPRTERKEASENLEELRDN